MGEALFAYSPAARRAAKSVRKALLRKTAETDVHAAGFGTKIGGLRPSDTSQGFFDSLDLAPIGGWAQTENLFRKLPEGLGSL